MLLQLGNVAFTEPATLTQILQKELALPYHSCTPSNLTLPQLLLKPQVKHA